MCLALALVASLLLHPYPCGMARKGRTIIVQSSGEHTVGRPTKYTQELGDVICEQLASGMSLRRVCLPETMPTCWSVFRWIDANAPFAQQYVRARELQADYYADEIADIADDGINDFMEVERGKGTVILGDHEHIHRSRLRVESRKWIASKLRPKRYGERIGVEASGPNGAPIGVKTETRNELIDAVLALVVSKPDAGKT